MSDEKYPKFGSLIKKAVKYDELKQRTLEVQLGLHEGAISAFIRGKRLLPAEQVKRLLERLVSMSDETRSLILEEVEKYRFRVSSPDLMIGARLHAIRATRHLRLSDFKDNGITSTVLSLIERSITMPNKRQLGAFCKVADIEQERLLTKQARDTVNEILDTYTPLDILTAAYSIENEIKFEEKAEK